METGGPELSSTTKLAAQNSLSGESSLVCLRWPHLLHVLELKRWLKYRGAKAA